VRLVEAVQAACALADPARRMAAAWQIGDFTAQDFINAGEEARKAERYEEALRWYERAAWSQPRRRRRFSAYEAGHSRRRAGSPWPWPRHKWDGLG